MKQLAQTTGLSLFEKLGKPLLVTYRNIFERLEQYEMLVADLQGMTKGRLRLAAVTTTQSFVPRLLRLFCYQYPGIEVKTELA
jgi:LysR family transcriptional regulator, low CO2-responsive transcriptional regulator